jgi:hypothetical protein
MLGEIGQQGGAVITRVQTGTSDPFLAGCGSGAMMRRVGPSMR